MYQGKSSALFVRYAVPQMIGLLFNSIYLIVDGIFIGNRLGSDAMAAAAVSVPLVEILISIAMAVGSGSGVMASEQLGRGDDKKAVDTFNLSVGFTVIVGVAIALTGWAFSQELSVLLGATDAIEDQAVEYLRYIVVFSPFLLLSFLLGTLARNDGRPGLAMTALAVGSLSNIALDYLFMYTLNMGITGAALATALGPVITVAILLPHFALKRGKLHFRRTQPNGRSVLSMLRLGSPSFVMEFSIGIVTLAYNIAIVKNGYGENGLAAYLIVGYLMLIIMTAFLGMAEGLQPVFSYLSGVGEKKRAISLRSFSSKVFLVIGLTCYLLVLALSRWFASLFTPDDTELIDLVQKVSQPYFLGFFLAGYNILMISFWQSTGKTGLALGVSLLRSTAIPPVLLGLLPALWGKEAIWICHSLSEGMVAVTVYGYINQLKRTNYGEGVVLRWTTRGTKR
ncbi:MAG: MATE family efflux transporter [Synergistales bacterium]|nr:MATE family efflux transporter [Synergistales bacterium]